MRHILTLLALSMSTYALADEAAVRAAVAKLAPAAKIDSIKPAPMADWSEVALGTRIVYVSNDGVHLMNGSLYAAAEQKDLTEASQSALRASTIKKLPDIAKISFSPAKPDSRVTVFTAIDCGFCRELHKHMDGYHERGIAVDYVVIPRHPPGTPMDIATRQLYCETDAQNAFAAALENRIKDKATCEGKGYDAGAAMAQTLGIQSTPTVVFSDGSLGAGFLTPEQMAERVAAAR